MLAFRATKYEYFHLVIPSLYRIARVGSQLCVIAVFRPFQDETGRREFELCHIFGTDDRCDLWAFMHDGQVFFRELVGVCVRDAVAHNQVRRNNMGGSGGGKQRGRGEEPWAHGCEEASYHGGGQWRCRCRGGDVGVQALADGPRTSGANRTRRKSGARRHGQISIVEHARHSFRRSAATIVIRSGCVKRNRAGRAGTGLGQRVDFGAGGVRHRFLEPRRGSPRGFDQRSLALHPAYSRAKASVAGRRLRRPRAAPRALRTQAAAKWRNLT